MWEECLEIFGQKHGRLAEFVAPTLEEIIRRDGLVELRRSVTEVEQRFFLALLLNVPARDDILSLVEQRFPGAPADNVIRWIEELTETSEFGTWILDAEFPPAIPGQPEAIFSALRHFVEGGDAAAPPDPFPLSAAELQVLRGVFLGSSLRALIG